MQASPLEDWSHAFGHGTHQVLVKRDGLLPFPLPGNKFRKLANELECVDPAVDTIITVGSVHSNHCRTAAMLAAQRGMPIHCVLHSEDVESERAVVGRRLLDALGTQSTVVAPDAISRTVTAVAEAVAASGRRPYVIEGGCHTPRGVAAYVSAVEELADQLDVSPAAIYLASGTGATQAGIVVGCKRLGWDTRVVGVSVARARERGRRAVEEAARWACGDGPVPIIEFTDEYRAGGYGQSDERTRAAVAGAWLHGLPVDPVYTGKALTGMTRAIEEEFVPRGSTIVFWHTGGMFQALTGSLS